MNAMDLVAIVTATVLSTVLGFAYYSPSVLGKQWMKEMGLGRETLESQKGMGKMYAVSTMGTFVNAVVLAVILNLTGATTMSKGIIISFLTWLGFMAPVQLTEVVFGGKSPRLFAINTGYQLLSNVVMGIIIVSLR